MTRYRIRLVEQSILEGSGDFTVEADTPELAAAVLLQAHEAARKECRDLVVLADGLAETRSVCRWSRRIEPREVIDNKLFCIRLDEAGDEIEPDDGPPPIDTRTQDSACPSGTEPWPC